VRRLLPVLIALAFPAVAQAEVVASGAGRDVMLATRAPAWLSQRIARAPDADARIAAMTPGAVLVESTRGLWLRLIAREGGRWRALRVVDAPRNARLGTAGLTLDARGRPAVAYALRDRDEKTSLWLARRIAGRFQKTRITKKGFPTSRVPPAAAPLLWPDGTLRVVETFTQRGANAILWRLEGKRWWGRVLHASALGLSPTPVYAAAAGDGVYVAWTVAYLEQGEVHVVLSTRLDRSRSDVLHRNAVAAGLVLGPDGPEVAANEVVDGLVAGLVLLEGPPVELDGRILAYARDPLGRWQVLVAREGNLEWFAAPNRPYVRVFLDGPLSGRVEGASGGVVRIYRERPDAPRELVAEVTADADGVFSASDPSPVAGTRYRVVYEREFPYALLVREPLT
jgi:hypothetical protein